MLFSGVVVLVLSGVVVDFVVEVSAAVVSIIGLAVNGPEYSIISPTNNFTESARPTFGFSVNFPIRQTGSSSLASIR